MNENAIENGMSFLPLDVIAVGGLTFRGSSEMTASENITMRDYAVN